MENNLPVTNAPLQTQPVSQAQTPPPAPSASPHRKILLLVLTLLIFVVLFAAGLIYWKMSSTEKIVTSNIAPTVTFTPTPTIDESGIKKGDGSDQALDTDSKTLDSDIQNVNNDLNIVDQSFSDKQTNLQ